MKCKKLIIFSGLLLSVFFSFSLSSNTFAKEDISVTFTNSSSSSSNGSSIFGSSVSDVSTFTSYSYLIVTFSPSRPSTASGTSYTSPLFYFRMNCTSGFPVFPATDSFFSINDYISCYRGDTPHFQSSVNWSSILSSGESVIFTLTDNLPGSGSSPTGNLDIIENGEYDVTDYATATVNVPQSSETPYDNKLDQIIQAIYVCAGTMLVIYFFYCIYRMIIKGVKV